MSPSFYWGVFTFFVGFLLVQAVVIGIAYGRATTRIEHLEKAKKEADEETRASDARVRALESKPAQDLSVVADKIKAELQHSLGERIAAVKTECIEDAAEVKRRVKDIEDARAKELLDKLAAADAELRRLRERQSSQSSARNYAVRADARREPDSDTPPTTNLPPRPEPRRR